MECIRELANSDRVKVTLLEDNKFELKTLILEVRELTRAIETLKKKGFHCVGENSREFHLDSDDTSITFQVTEFNSDCAEDIVSTFLGEVAKLGNTQSKEMYCLICCTESTFVKNEDNAEVCSACENVLSDGAL